MLVQKQMNMHTRSYELCPASARVMPGLQPLLSQPLWLIACKTVHLMQHTNNPRAFGLFSHQLQTSLHTPQLDPIYPFHATAPWARQKHWQSTYKYNISFVVCNSIPNPHALWLHLQQAGHSKIPGICHP